MTKSNAAHLQSNFSDSAKHQGGGLQHIRLLWLHRVKCWPEFHSREFRTLQPTRWDSGWIYELGQSPEKCTGSHHRDWKSNPSQRLSHSLTTPNPPRDNCALLSYRTLKWSWQSSIFGVIWACRMASTAFAVFEFCPIEVPFSRSSCLCFSFSPPSPPSQHSCSQIKNIRLALETIKYGLHMEGKAIPHIWCYILAAQGLRCSALTLWLTCTTAGRRGENLVMKPSLYSLQAMLPECNLMTDYSVHAELLSSLYESPGSRCSARTRLSVRASVVLGCCGCRSQPRSASSALASYQPHAIISEMTVNGSWRFVSRVFWQTDVWR